MNNFNLKFSAQKLTKEQMKNVTGGELPTCSGSCWYGDDDEPTGDLDNLSSCDASYLQFWCEFYYGDGLTQANCTC